MKVFFILISLLFLVSCAQNSAKNLSVLSPESKIFVVSLLGDKLVVDHKATTVFGNYNIIEDVSQWNMNQYIESFVSSQGRVSGKFKYIENAPPNNELRQKGQDFVNGEIKEKQYRAYLSDFAEKIGADLIILLEPIGFEARKWDPVAKSGYVIHQRSAFGKKSSSLEVSINMFVLDTKNEKQIAYEYSSGYSDTKSYWFLEKEAISGDVKQSLEAEVKGLLDRVLLMGISDFGLVKK